MFFENEVAKIVKTRPLGVITRTPGSGRSAPPRTHHTVPCLAHYLVKFFAKCQKWQTPESSKNGAVKSRPFLAELNRSCFVFKNVQNLNSVFKIFLLKIYRSI